MKEVQMTFRVEAELRTSFTQAAELEARPAAQVLRELMRAYVSQSHARRGLAPANDAAADAERRRREDAVNFARASVGLEGFEPSTDAIAHAERFINGDLELSSLVSLIPAGGPAVGR